MSPRYQVGEIVRVKELTVSSSDPRSVGVGQYSGQVGKVIDYYWISPRFSAVFYLYRVKFGDEQDEIVFHEDELQECIE